jgi:hypothetical protein
MCPSNTPPLFGRRGGVYPVLVPRYMLVPRDTVRSTHKVMRFVHGHVWGLLGSLLGHTPLPYAVRLLGLCVGFVWACWVFVWVTWRVLSYLVRIKGYALFA